ncbi:ATP-dependent helicase [Haemophilus paracuniculus]|uniref:ATP-dependent helicase n=1 Tax=Haemophilus paracuniculus TaxID=734 RepID=A0A1T0AQS0_9PAST|nr:SNF2-related protein [Haemophilus paracuniculus]OOR98379.1 ATP-dependent helicase [Haemophilus paracuniculus]
MNLTAYHARYYANEIVCRSDEADRLSESLFDAKVDLNPHQIDAALFALKNPQQQGVMLADEVGLGKTIEAALVLCQLWAERKRRLLITCPAVLCKQWANELQEKFALPSLVVDRAVIKKSGLSPKLFFEKHCGKQILIFSHQFAVKCEPFLVGVPWNLVVIDEAHKFRNAHRASNRMGQALRRIFGGKRKLLLTATPLQNSLMELYGLSTLLDDYLFGNEKTFRKTFVNGGGDLDGLRERLQTFVKRTLRKNVLEYVHYTQRKTITQQFDPTNEEQALYDNISHFLQQEQSYALPKRSRHLVVLILRKLLASSPKAVVDTLHKILDRLQKMKENLPLADEDFLAEFEDLDSDEAEWVNEEDEASDIDDKTIDLSVLDREIEQIQGFINQANALTQDSKALALLEALNIGFRQMATLGAEQKAIIFTESTRTQQFLVDFLSQNGYADKLVAFSGTNNQAQATEIYHKWLKAQQGSECVTGSAEVDKRTALIDYFKESAQIMIATEAAAEGVNLQFCSLLINYDLPWNPQRIEQRIGRCHRYGQKFDVVVINFLNQRNLADRRVLELLDQKFSLFEGVFGASDEILGSIEDGRDVERQILAIYQSCRTPEEIQQAFDALQAELEEKIRNTMKQTESQLFSHFDQDVLERLKGKVSDRLNNMQRWVWNLTKFVLADYAKFNDDLHEFSLHKSPEIGITTGLYHFLRQKQAQLSFLQGVTYRLTHPLGEWCLKQALNLATPNCQLSFKYEPLSHGKFSVIAERVGQSGWLRIDKICINSELETQEKLVFTACTDNGETLDANFCQKLFMLSAKASNMNCAISAELNSNAELRIDATINQINDQNVAQLNEMESSLERWADEQIRGLSEALTELNEQIKEAKRQSRNAQSLAEKAQFQQKIKELERQVQQSRRAIFDKEDEICEKRDELIEQMSQRLKQQTTTETLFCVRWTLGV